VGPPGAQNYTQLTITKVTSTKNEGGGGGGDLLEGMGDLVQVIAGELGLKKTGVGELEELLHEYGVDWVGEAFKESVRRGKLTLRYMEGILKNWKRTGRAVPRLKSEADRDARIARSSEAEQERAAVLRRAEAGKKAFELVERVIATLPAEDLALLKDQSEVECDREGVPGVVRDAMVTSKIRKKVARDYGIEGL
jgi:DnaD/phage-associated family protein